MSESFWVLISLIIFILVIIKFVKPVLAKILDSQIWNVKNAIVLGEKNLYNAQVRFDNAEKKLISSKEEAQKMILNIKQEIEQLKASKVEELNLHLAKRNEELKEDIQKLHDNAELQLRDNILKRAQTLSIQYLQSIDDMKVNTEIDRLLKDLKID